MKTGFSLKTLWGLHGADGNPACAGRRASGGSSGPKRADCVDLQWAVGACCEASDFAAIMTDFRVSTTGG